MAAHRRRLHSRSSLALGVGVEGAGTDGAEEAKRESGGGLMLVVCLRLVL